MDIKYSFLHGDLQEEIYMKKTLGFIQNDAKLVCHLKKSLYGLKKVTWAWYPKMDIFLLDTIFSRCHFENNVCTKLFHDHLIILVLSIDDLVLTK